MSGLLRCILLLAAWLWVSRGAGGPGAVLRMDVGTISHAVSTALNGSGALQKVVEEAMQKKPNGKPVRGVSGLKLKELQPPSMSLQLSPGAGLSLAVLVQMRFTGKSLVGGRMELQVAANVSSSSRVVRDARGCPQLSAGRCRVALLSASTNLPSRVMTPAARKFLESTLQRLLPGLLCPAVDMVLDLVNAKFTTMTSVIALGSAGTLRYALLDPPVVSASFIQLELETILHSREGKEVLPTEQPSLTSLPPKKDNATQLVLSAGFLSAELRVMQASFSLNISNSMVLGLPPLGTTMLGALVPEISSVLPPSQPVVIEMQEAKPPLVTITPNKSTVHLFSTAEFWVPSPDSAPGSLFVLDVHTELGVHFAVAEERLQLSLALDSLSQVAVANSSIGAFDVLPLRTVLADIVHVAFVSSINRVLRGGVPLPPLPSAPYQHVELSQMQDGLVLDVPVTEL